MNNLEQEEILSEFSGAFVDRFVPMIRQMRTKNNADEMPIMKTCLQILYDEIGVDGDKLPEVE